jgi:hypothetical protein
MEEYENPFAESDEVLRGKLVTETAQIEWRSLQLFFASGKAVRVSSGTDLVDVAFALSTDDGARFGGFMANARVALVSDDEARRWYDDDALVWAVVVRPWVLVQCAADQSDGPS